MMAKKGGIHIVQTGGGWGVKRAGNERSTSVHPTQEKARKEAVKIAKKESLEVLIHGRDGKIRARESYGTESKKKDTEH